MIGDRFSDLEDDDVLVATSITTLDTVPDESLDGMFKRCINYGLDVIFVFHT